MAKCARSEIETDDVVAALDATDTDAHAAEQLGCSARTVIALAIWREEVRRARERQAERRCARVVVSLDEADTAAEAAKRLGMSERHLSGFAAAYQDVAHALQRQRDRRDEAIAELQARAQQHADVLITEIRRDWHNWPANTVGAKLRQLRGAMEIAKGARGRRSEK